MFNRQMIEYREHGDLERLQRFWLQGACKPDKRKRSVLRLRIHHDAFNLVRNGQVHYNGGLAESEKCK